MEPGERLGRYDLLVELGRGGMGAVFSARDLELDRVVAIKVLAPLLASDSGFVERFRREARTVAQLRHPNIVVLHDWGNQDGVPYLVMELLAGQSLKELIRQRGRLPVPMVLATIQQCASALDYAHGRGLVHRDVKPANVMIDDGGHVTLTDFGIARAAGGGQLTATGGVVGTPEYLSPEQAQGRPVDGQSDVYSLGITLYELLVGQVPFRADSTPGILYMHVHTPPPPLGLVRPDLPPAVTQVVERGLAKDPASRYPTAGALAADLEAAFGRRAQVSPIDEDALTARAHAATFATEPAGSPAARVAAAPLPPATLEPARPSTARWLAVGVGGVAILAIAVSLMPAGDLGIGRLPTSRAGATDVPPAAALPTSSFVAGTPTAAAVGPPTALPLSPTLPLPTVAPVVALIHEADGLLADDTEGALAKHQQAASRDPDSALARRQLGIALFHLARNHDDLPHLEQATRLDPTDSLAWAYLCASAFINYQYDNSVQAAERAAAASPDAAETHAALALRALSRSDFDAARREADQALDRNPDGDLVQWVSTLVRTFNGDLDAALAPAQKLAERRARWASAHLLAGSVLRLRYDLDGARRAYEQALALDSKVLWAHTYLGWIFIIQGRVDEAAQAFQTALQRDPRSAEAVAGLGYVALAKQDFQTASSTFRRATDINPRENAGYSGLGWTLALGYNSPIEAEPMFRRALEIFPNDSSAWRGLGITQFRRGQFEPALTSFQSATRVAPNDPDNDEWIGRTLAQLGRFREARQHLERASALKPGDAGIQRDLSDVTRRGG